jgi:hypothetical protein
MAARMSRRRLIAAHGLIGVLLAGHAWCLIMDREYWPFSQYPLYATLARPGAFDYLMLFGVPSGGQPEFAITQKKYIQPFDWVRLNRAFARLEARPDDETQLAAGLQDCWARYDRLRDAGRHRGPALDAIRLYRYAWDHLDPRTSEADAQPDRRILLAEVTSGARREAD